MHIEQFLSLFQKIKKSGSGWTAKCPAHKDRISSLSIGATADEKILIKCHAGCTAKEILEVLNLSWQDLFPKPFSRNRKPAQITIADLAKDKGLPEDFLLYQGVEQKQNYIRISYYLENGILAPRQRKRSALSAKKGSFWEKGFGKPMPYGLWKLSEARSHKYLILVEGESDTWTLWFHGFPCLGLPGANMAKKLELAVLSSIEKIYLIEEPDKGGQTFVEGIRKRLHEIHWPGVAFVIKMQKYKDPNELHQKSFNFKADFIALIENAKPISLVEPEAKITVDYGDLIPSLPQPKNKTVLELIEKAIKATRHFAILAPQGSGKSYANASIAVDQLFRGRSTIIFSRSHDELNQLGKTISEFLNRKDLPEYHLFHLMGGQNANIPDIRPIIIIAPHIYLLFKGESPYHHTIADLIIKDVFGTNPLILIDEVTSFIEMSFLSKMLGSKETLKNMFSKEIWIRNRLCPLFTKSSNCLNCKSNSLLNIRKNDGGLYYTPISQYSNLDKFSGESADFTGIVDFDFFYDENTLRIFPVLHQKNRCREWSTGKKNDKQLEISLQSWFEDFVNRSVNPHLVCYYPYNLESQENLGSPLSEEQLKQRKNKKLKIIPPRQVCGTYILQGWDLAILKEISKKAQIGFTGPGLSQADRFVLNQAIGEINYHLAQNPFVTFKKVLILCLEKYLEFNDKETLELLQSLTKVTKVLSFLPTKFEAEKAEKQISKTIPTMFYDGAQKISNAPIKGTSIEFDLCVSYIHGPLGQGIDLEQFKMAIVSTACEKPKCLFINKPVTKSIQDYILNDVAENCQQAALRILRLKPDEKANSPRVVLFYGRKALEVGKRVQKELSAVGHIVKLTEAQESIKYAQQYTVDWIVGKDVSKLESIGVTRFVEQDIMEKAREKILEYLKKKPGVGWRDLEKGIKTIRLLSKSCKLKLRVWLATKHTS